ncbi:hypothetical protein FQN54_004130 [Arachnomyces sp. PD_36]|nr:hypothetical protein FQN54_004130 [Arachnomyces sp. PD_36]
MEPETNKLVDLVREVVLEPLSRILPTTTNSTAANNTPDSSSAADDANVADTTQSRKRGKRKGKRSGQNNGSTDRIKNRSRVGARRDDWMRATALEFRARNAPEPLGVRRKRRLTLSPGPGMERARVWSFGEGQGDGERSVRFGIGRRKKELGRAGETNAQACSDLFRLPLELRKLVYAYALADGAGEGGGRCLHVVRMEKGRRLAHVRCCAFGDEQGLGEGETGNEIVVRAKRKERDHDCWGYTTHLGGYYSRPKHGFSERDGGLLSLLKSCRKVYSEAIDILYTQNTFDFNHVDTILNLSTTILPYRLHSIRHLNLHWTVRALTWMDAYPPYDESTWLRLCRTLSASPPSSSSHSTAPPAFTSSSAATSTPHMPGLVNLHITLRSAADSSSFYPGEKKLLDPLRLIRQPRVFRVYFPWELREDMVVSLRDAPFALRTPSGEWVGARRVEEDEGEGWY